MTKNKRPPSSGEQTAIGGYFKQYEYSAAVLYQLMQIGSFEGICLCEPAADIFDDLVIFSEGHVKAVQVKSERNATYASLKTEFKGDLISSMVRAWQNLKEKFQREVHLTYIFGGLFNNQDTVLANEGQTGARHSAEFARFLSRGDLTAETVQSSIWSETVEDLRTRSGLDEATFFEFLAGLSLEDERALHTNSISSFQPSERDNVEAIRSLLPRLVSHTESGAIWLEQDLVGELGWQSRLSQRNSHVFPVAADYQTNSAAPQLLERISGLSKGYIALVGPPGTGKSTLLQRELFGNHEFRVARYLAFHPDKRHGLGRAEAVEFFNDVIADLYTLGIHGSRFRSDSLAGLRQEFTRQLTVANSEFKASGRKTIIAIDGLDHVPREETPQVSFLNELPAASSIPDGVILVLGTQRVELPGVHPTIIQQLKSESRTVTIEPLTKSAVAELADAAGLPVFVSRQKLYDSCDGHPLSARYYVEALKNASTEAEAEAIFAADGLGQSLEQIYARVWSKVEHTKATKDALALLARAEADVSCEQLAAASDDETVESVLQNAGFLLKRSANNRLSIYHNSFRLHVSRETAKRFGQFNRELDATFQSQLASLAESASQDDPQFWMRLRYLFRANDHDGVLALGKPEYFRASLRALRPSEEVFSDLRFVYGSIKERGDRVELLRTLLAEKETAYRLEAVSEIDFVDLLLQLGDVEMATRHALATGDTGLGWLRLVDHYWDQGQTDRARQVFEANEPLEVFFGEDGFDPNQEMDLAESWIQRAHRFRPTEKLLKLIAELATRRSRSAPREDDEDNSWVSGRLNYHLALGILNDGAYEDLASLQKKLELSQEESATLAVRAAELAFSKKAIDTARANLKILKENGAIEQADQSWRRSAAKIALALGDLDYGRKLARTLTVPRLDREAMSHDMQHLSRAIVDSDHLAVALDLEIPEEAQRVRLEPSDLLASAHNKLRNLGRLRGLATRQDAGLTSNELRTLVLFFASAKPERGDFDGQKYYAALPSIAIQVLKAAKDAGDRCFVEIVSLLDEIIARNDNNFSGSDKFRLAFATTVFRFNADAQQAFARISAVEGKEKTFHTPHEAAESYAAIASSYCTIGQPELARNCLNKLHDKTFGYWLRAKKEPQYEFWKWIFSRACSEFPDEMESGALSFAQFLLGMDETEGSGTAYRVYQCLLEGSFVSPSAAAGIARRMYDSDIGTWAGITEAALTSVVKGQPTLASLAIIASAQLVVPFAEDGLERLLSNALPTMSAQERAGPIDALIQSIERWCPPSKRELIIDTIIDYAPETRSDLESLQGDAALTASELRRVTHGEPRESDDSHGYSNEIDVESLTALVAHSDGRSAYGDRVDYSYADAAERLIDAASETEILEFLSERPHIEASTKCMVAISRRFFANGKRMKAEEFLAKAEASSTNGHWSNFLGGEKLAVQKLRTELFPETAVDNGFETLTSELARGTTVASALFLNLDEVLELVTDPVPVAEFWAETQEHLEQYREFNLANPVRPITSVETHTDLLAFVIAQGFNLACPEVTVHARQAAEAVVRNTTDPRFFEKIVELLHHFPDGHREAAALMDRLTDQAYLSTTLKKIARQELERADLVVSTLSQKVLHDLGEVAPEALQVELPAFYRLQPLGGEQPLNFDPPPGLLSDGRAVWSDDPWTWTSMLRESLHLASKASGIPLEMLRRRCAMFMHEEGGRDAFGPEAEKELLAKLRCLVLPFPYRRPMALTALRAIGRLLNELSDANAIDPKVLPVMWEDIGGPSLRCTLPPEEPKPVWLEWPDLPIKQHGGIDAEAWMSASEQCLASTIVPGGLILAQITHFSLHAFRETATLDKLTLPKGVNLSEGVYRLPRVFSLDESHPMYDESESVVVSRIAGNLFGDIEDQTLCICPYLAKELGWVSTNNNPLVLRDAGGNVVCETIRWVEGTYRHQPSYDAEMFGKGQFLHITEIGLSRFRSAGIDIANGVRVSAGVKRESKEPENREFIALG